VRNLIPFIPRALITVLMGLLVVLAWHSPTQALADAYVDAGLKRALVSFATARTLNAAISVAQGTQISAQPLGLGVSLAVGELLDPVNDLVEQFSTLMLWASISFGVQKALLALTGQWGLSALFTGLALIWAALHWRGAAPEWLTKMLLIVMLMRFAVPVSALASDFVYTKAFSSEFVQQHQAIEGVAKQATQSARQATTISTEDSRGFWEKLRDRFTNALPIAALESLKTSLEALPERIVKLMVIFLLQTLILPIAFLWLFLRVVLGATWPAGHARGGSWVPGINRAPGKP
jgi:hypothetical protein